LLELRWNLDNGSSRVVVTMPLKSDQFLILRLLHHHDPNISLPYHARISNIDYIYLPSADLFGRLYNSLPSTVFTVTVNHIIVL